MKNGEMPEISGCVMWTPGPFMPNAKAKLRGPHARTLNRKAVKFSDSLVAARTAPLG
jgi:hypothetical protein